MPPAKPPAANVFKDNNVWRWTCNTCLRSEWRGRHPDALSDVDGHLRTHREFGFGGKR